MSQQLGAGAPPLKPLLEVKGLKKYFEIRKGLFSRHVGDVKAVDDISFDIYPKETLGVVGESGCGKTTAGRTLLRLLEPTAGSAIFDGKNVFGLTRSEMRAMRRHMQIIFQDPYSSLNPRQTVGSIIGDALELHGLARGDERFDRAKELLERVGLQSSYINRYPHEFSGGQRQRIGIARAVALKPKFIVCDEAVSALDVSVQAQILNLLMDLQDEYNLSYMFIAHDLSVVRHISDRVAVMYLGRIVELSVCDDLYDAPLHPYTQALLSAIPRAKPGRRTDRVILQGDVPNPIAPPSGCHFHPRCPLAFDRCRTEAPKMLDVRPGHRVRCHLYEDAAFGAEPIPIGSARPTPAPTPAAAAAAPVPAEPPTRGAVAAAAASAIPAPADDSMEFGMFDGSVNGDSDRPSGIPEVLADRAGMALGPFGEVIDPEDSFVRTAEIPRLDALVEQTAVSIADEAAPLGTDDADMGPGDASLEPTVAGTPPASTQDPDVTATHSDMPVLESSGGLEEEPTVLATPPPAPVVDAALEPTMDIPTESDIDPASFELEPTVDAPAPEATGAMPPIHDLEGAPDDVSLMEEDGVPTIPPDDAATMDLPVLKPEPTGKVPPADDKD